MSARFALGASLLAMVLDDQPFPRASAYGTRGKVGTSRKVKERRKRERQNKKRGRR